VADLVDSIGAGVTCPPSDPAALAAAVGSLQALPADERRAMGDRGALAARTRYSREVLTGEIETVLRRAVEGKN
jgi:glycosyltransferase involved in cell wall biosynthesis